MTGVQTCALPIYPPARLSFTIIGATATTITLHEVSRSRITAYLHVAARGVAHASLHVRMSSSTRTWSTNVYTSTTGHVTIALPSLFPISAGTMVTVAYQGIASNLSSATSLMLK